MDKEILNKLEEALQYEKNSYMPHNGTIEKLEQLKKLIERASK